jgi:hypothetical protein
MGIDAINFLLELQLIEPEMTGVQPPHLIHEIRPRPGVPVAQCTHAGRRRALDRGSRALNIPRISYFP